MKLIDVLLLGVAFLFLIIGVDQAIVLGFSHAYWAFMLALISFFGFNYRKGRRAASKPDQDEKPRKSRKR